MEEEEVEMSFFAALPDVAVTIGSTAVSIRNRIQRELDKTVFCKYIAFTNVPPSLLEDRKRPIFPKSTRIFYNHDTRQLLVKLVATPHEIAERTLEFGVNAELLSMGLATSVVLTGSGRIRGNACSKEPDGTWRHKSLPAGRTTEWPSVVIETGVSEGWTQLKRDAEWWINNSHGQVKLVILIRANKSLPEIKYETIISGAPSPALRSGRVRYQCLPRQSIVQSRPVNQPGAPITTVGVTPLVVKFDEIFLRQPAPPEHDIHVSLQWMEHISRTVWAELGI
ncbi:hypothetical protein N7474_002609 [Penicillium riverlandense]|uniref:uncharacterized protein n=1 Tax=Penicillium riverlandense TaxID=1903569 RepID=UPI0025480E94|nr:uncharacterized protein N7474_002609 [Penicillium riverlandense]KAJ5825471.1 hypothetical protein N7474_002609 [Penicillium riverlandense]